MVTEGELLQAQQRTEALEAAAFTFSHTGVSTRDLLDRAQACFEWLASGRKTGEVVRLTTASMASPAAGPGA